MPCGIEVHDLAGEVLHRLDLGPDEDVRLRGEQVHEVVDAPPGVGELGLGLEMVEHVAVDDGRVHAAQVEQVVDVVERPARDDRQHAHVVAVVEHARELGRELQRRALEAPGGEPDRPGVDAVLVRLLAGSAGLTDGRRLAAWSPARCTESTLEPQALGCRMAPALCGGDCAASKNGVTRSAPRGRQRMENAWRIDSGPCSDHFLSTRAAFTAGCRRSPASAAPSGARRPRASPWPR